MHGALSNEDEEAVENEYDQLIKESLPEVPIEKISEVIEPELPDVPTKEPGIINCIDYFKP